MKVSVSAVPYLTRFTLCCSASLLGASLYGQQERPNIVFFLTEDLSPHYLALYNNGRGAVTPNVEKLARQGYIYTNAYSNAPVSSAARTTLITGCYAPSFGGSFHRKLVEKPMPDGLHMFPYYLRQQGYYTCNAVKTDYNVVLDKQAWDDISGAVDGWRQRKKKDQPFFFQRSNMLTHESQLHFDINTYHFKQTRNNPADVFIHPYLPDTPLMRYTYAHFYDLIEDSDRELGEIVSFLRQDGLLDNTFIFYFGDNGGVLPGTKGYTDDIGLHVPLVVYVPEKWREKMNLPIGSRQDGLLSFMDLPATALNLAGIQIPQQMDGKPFLGPNAVYGRDAVYCYGDRFDELYAFNRVIRKGKYRYARNYQPYHTQSLFAFYRYIQLAFKEWKSLFEAGQLNPLQSTFFQPFGAEELYDLENDPNELHNLAYSVPYEQLKKEMRADLNQYMIQKADLGFFPETILLEKGIDNPFQFGHNNQERIAHFIQIADLQMNSFDEAESALKRALSEKDEVAQWWALTSCASFGKSPRSLQPKIRKLLSHNRSFVQSRAMVVLSIFGHRFKPATVYQVLRHCKTGAEALLVLNDLTFMVEQHLLSPFQLKPSDIPEMCTGIDWRIDYLNQKFNQANTK